MDARKINDDSLEWLILVTRGASVAFAIGGIAFLALTVAFASPARFYGDLAASGLVLAVACFSSWLGWYRLGNEEWRTGLHVMAGAPCGAHYRGMTCNVQVDDRGRHDGPHMDGLRDPTGVKTWN